MRLVVTGGGTGGHVYPAVEVARAAASRGWEVEYLGSLRGQEGKACGAAGLRFRGFASEPVYRATSLRGLRSLWRLLRSSLDVGRVFRERRPDVVFATGGYAAAPVLQAARKAGVAIVVHEQNSVPGRTNRILGAGAKAVCTVFRATERHFPGARVVRTGMPIRRALRDSAQGRLLLDAESGSVAPLVLVMGGSQGSEALNDMALSTAVRMATTDVQWLHVTGLSHFESTVGTLERMGVRGSYTVKAYLDAEEMASAMFHCSVAVCRSGAGTLSELAAFRKPMVLVPYPHAFGDHQTANAREFLGMGAADLVAQGELDPAGLEGRILAWLTDGERQRSAREAMADWDVPDAVERILGVIGGSGP